MRSERTPEGLRQAVFSAVIVHGNTPYGLHGMAEIIADAIWAAMTWEDERGDDAGPSDWPR